MSVICHTYKHTVVFLCAVVIALVSVPASAAGGAAEDKPLLRVGVLEFGTVSWEMDTVQRLGLAQKHGVRLKVIPLASKNALKVALQGQEVDLIVSDWLWVARQRVHDRQFEYVPYSRAVGAVMINPDAGVDSLADLEGMKIGIAGGPVDKSWLIAGAYTKKMYGFNLEDVVKPRLAAPPMINRLMVDGRLSAAINYWHCNARLSALGMQRLITVEQMLK